MIRILVLVLASLLLVVASGAAPHRDSLPSRPTLATKDMQIQLHDKVEQRLRLQDFLVSEEQGEDAGTAAGRLVRLEGSSRSQEISIDYSHGMVLRGNLMLDGGGGRNTLSVDDLGSESALRILPLSSTSASLEIDATNLDATRVVSLLASGRPRHLRFDLSQHTNLNGTIHIGTQFHQGLIEDVLHIYSESEGFVQTLVQAGDLDALEIIAAPGVQSYIVDDLPQTFTGVFDFTGGGEEDYLELRGDMSRATGTNVKNASVRIATDNAACPVTIVTSGPIFVSSACTCTSLPITLRSTGSTLEIGVDGSVTTDGPGGDIVLEAETVAEFQGPVTNNGPGSTDIVASRIHFFSTGILTTKGDLSITADPQSVGTAIEFESELKTEGDVLIIALSGSLGIRFDELVTATAPIRRSFIARGFSVNGVLTTALIGVQFNGGASFLNYDVEITGSASTLDPVRSCTGVRFQNADYTVSDNFSSTNLLMVSGNSTCISSTDSGNGVFIRNVPSFQLDRTDFSIVGEMNSGGGSNAVFVRDTSITGLESTVDIEGKAAAVTSSYRGVFFRDSEIDLGLAPLTLLSINANMLSNDGESTRVDIISTNITATSITIIADDNTFSGGSSLGLKVEDGSTLIGDDFFAAASNGGGVNGKQCIFITSASLAFASSIDLIGIMIPNPSSVTDDAVAVRIDQADIETSVLTIDGIGGVSPTWRDDILGVFITDTEFSLGTGPSLITGSGGGPMNGQGGERCHGVKFTEEVTFFMNGPLNIFGTTGPHSQDSNGFDFAAGAILTIDELVANSFFDFNVTATGLLSQDQSLPNDGAFLAGSLVVNAGDVLIDGTCNGPGDCNGVVARFNSLITVADPGFLFLRGSAGTAGEGSGVLIDGDLTLMSDAFVTVEGYGATSGFSPGVSFTSGITDDLVLRSGSAINVIGFGGDQGGHGVHFNAAWDTVVEVGVTVSFIGYSGTSQVSGSNYGVFVDRSLSLDAAELDIYGENPGTATQPDNVGVFVDGTIVCGLLFINGTGGNGLVESHGVRIAAEISADDTSITGKFVGGTNSAGVLVDVGGSVSADGDLDIISIDNDFTNLIAYGVRLLGDLQADMIFIDGTCETSTFGSAGILSDPSSTITLHAENISIFGTGITNFDRGIVLVNVQVESATSPALCSMTGSGIIGVSLTDFTANGIETEVSAFCQINAADCIGMEISGQINSGTESFTIVDALAVSSSNGAIGLDLAADVIAADFTASSLCDGPSCISSRVRSSTFDGDAFIIASASSSSGGATGLELSGAIEIDGIGGFDGIILSSAGGDSNVGVKYSADLLLESADDFILQGSSTGVHQSTGLLFVGGSITSVDDNFIELTGATDASGDFATSVEFPDGSSFSISCNQALPCVVEVIGNTSNLSAGPDSVGVLVASQINVLGSHLTLAGTGGSGARGHGIHLRSSAVIAVAALGEAEIYFEGNAGSSGLGILCDGCSINHQGIGLLEFSATPSGERIEFRSPITFSGPEGDIDFLDPVVFQSTVDFAAGAHNVNFNGLRCSGVCLLRNALNVTFGTSNVFADPSSTLTINPGELIVSEVGQWILDSSVVMFLRPMLLEGSFTIFTGEGNLQCTFSEVDGTAGAILNGDADTIYFFSGDIGADDPLESLRIQFPSQLVFTIGFEFLEVDSVFFSTSPVTTFSYPAVTDVSFMAGTSITFDEGSINEPALGVTVTLEAPMMTLGSNANNLEEVVLRGSGVAVLNSPLAVWTGDLTITESVQAEVEASSFNVVIARDTAKLSIGGPSDVGTFDCQGLLLQDQSELIVTIGPVSGVVDSVMTDTLDVSPTAKLNVENVAAALPGTYVFVVATSSAAGTFANLPDMSVVAGPPSLIIDYEPLAYQLIQNEPPFAMDDMFIVTGPTFTEPAPGVLSNDGDPDGDPFTAVLVSGPPVLEGMVTLLPDGSFTYVSGGFDGETTFTYRVTDGIGISDIATVTLDVISIPSNSPSRSVSPSISETASKSVTASKSITPTQSESSSKSESPSTSFSASKSESSSKSVTSSKSKTASKSFSPSKSESSSKSVTPSKSESASKSESPSKSFSPSKSESASKSESPSRTRTPSISESSSSSRTASKSKTASTSLTSSTSRSHTATVSDSTSFLSSPSSTPSGTPTPTKTPSRSSTPSTTVSASATATSTQSPTKTTTSTPTGSETPTPTSSSTISAQPSPTASMTPTTTGTGTQSSTPSVSGTRTSTLTPTTTKSASPSASETTSATPTTTESPSSTSSTSTTASATSSLSQTPSPTLSVSQTPTPTESSSETESSTASNSGTPSSTTSSTETRTASHTSSNSPTSTVTPSSTLSAGASPSATQSGTMTSSATGTMTSSMTQTPTESSSTSTTTSVSQSPTSTPSASVSATVTGTGTPSTSATSTSLDTLTGSQSAGSSTISSQSSSASRSRTTAASESRSASMTATETRTQSETMTATPSASTTPTSSMTVTASPSSSVTPTPAPTGPSTLSSTPTPSSTTSETTSLSNSGTPTVSETATTTPLAVQATLSPSRAAASATQIAAAPEIASATRTPSKQQVASPTRTRTPSASRCAGDFCLGRNTQAGSGNDNVEIPMEVTLIRSDNSNPTEATVFSSGGRRVGTVMVPPDTNDDRVLVVGEPGDNVNRIPEITSTVIDVTVLANNGESLTSFDEPIELCFSTEGLNANDVCLGFYNDDGEWECQDFCLDSVSREGEDLLCGETDHLTNFALLFSDEAGSDSKCGSDSTDLLYVYLSAGAVGIGCCVVLIAVVGMEVWFRLDRIKTSRTLTLSASKQSSSGVPQFVEPSLDELE